MLKKMVDGKEVECSPEEEASILAEWNANAAKAIEDQKSLSEKKALSDKFGDIPTFLDKLCKKLNIDPNSL